MTATTPEAVLPDRRLPRRVIATIAVVGVALILVALLAVLQSSSPSTTADPTRVPAVVDGVAASRGLVSADAAERHALATAERCIDGFRSPDAIERCQGTSGSVGAASAAG